MGLGELILVAISEENIYLSNKPQITFFKSVFKKYSNFAIETIPQYSKSNPDFGKKLSIDISKNADLLHKLQVYVELPSLPKSNHSSLPSDIKKIKWANKIGHVLIDYIDLEIGGLVIDRLYGDFLNIWSELTNNLEIKDGFSKIIGNISNLNEYTNGKNKYKLNIPFNFWFSQEYGLALPLLSLTHQDIKIHIQFNDLNECVKESPSHYFETSNLICLFQENEIMTQDIEGKISKGEFVYFDIKNQRVYYNKLLGDFQIPSENNSNYNIIGSSSKFEILPKINTYIIKDESYFYNGKPIIKEAYILADYIYLDNFERVKFINKNHEYLINKIRYTIHENLYNTNNNYKISLVNPVKTIFWRCILKNNIDINDKFNYTTYPLTEERENIIKNHLIIINSIKREEISTWEYYDYIQKYKNKFNNISKGIYNYSFCLNPLEYQPSGSINFSKIDDSYLQITLNSAIDYQNPCQIFLYSLQYNVFNIIDGIGGLKYYL